MRLAVAGRRAIRAFRAFQAGGWSRLQIRCQE